MIAVTESTCRPTQGTPHVDATPLDTIEDLGLQSQGCSVVLGLHLQQVRAVDLDARRDAIMRANQLSRFALSDIIHDASGSAVCGVSRRTHGGHRCLV